MFNQLSIRHKVITMAATILLLIGISGWKILSTVTPVADSWHYYQEQAAMRQELLMAIKADFGYGGMIHNFKNYVLRDQGKYRDRINQNAASLSSTLIQYHGLGGLTKAEKAALAAIKQVAQTYHDNSRRIGELRITGKNIQQIDSLIKISDTPAFEAFEVLDTHYKKMTSAFSEQINRSISGAEVAIVSALMVVAVVIMTVLCWLYFSVIPPLRLLNHTMDDIAEGQGDLSVRLDQSRNDELGRLAASFNIFIDKIQHVIIEEKQVIEQLASSASELKDITDSSNQAIESQLSHTEQLVSAVTEMTSTVNNIAKNATTASGSTAQADQTAGMGQTAVTDTVNQIQNIHHHLDQASVVINQVSEASEQIGQVLSVISEIADQTNLLALNAAIEAARAGESGRGFAVVADEVRGLAQRTAVSLSDINNIINQLQSGAKEAVQTMEHGVREVAAGATIAQTAGSNISNIVAEIKTIYEMNMQIATATEEQSCVTAEMNQNVHQISSMSSTIFGDSKQIAEQSIRLANMTVRLQELVAGFKTS